MSFRDFMKEKEEINGIMERITNWSESLTSFYESLNEIENVNIQAALLNVKMQRGESLRKEALSQAEKTSDQIQKKVLEQMAVVIHTELKRLFEAKTAILSLADVKKESNIIEFEEYKRKLAMKFAKKKEDEDEKK